MTYEIMCSTFLLRHLTRHKFAESSLQYCLIKLINEQNCFNKMTDQVQRTPFYSFKVFLKQRVPDKFKSIHAKLTNVKLASLFIIYVICKLQVCALVEIIALICGTFTMNPDGLTYNCL